MGRVEVLIQFDKDLLHDIFGQPGVARERNRIAIHQPVVRGESLLKIESRRRASLRRRLRFPIGQADVRSVYHHGFMS